MTLKACSCVFLPATTGVTNLSAYRGHTSHKYEHSRPGVKKKKLLVSLGYSSVFPLCIEKYWAQRSISVLLGNNSAMMVKCSDKVQPIFIPGIEKQ